MRCKLNPNITRELIGMGVAIAVISIFLAVMFILSFCIGYILVQTELWIPVFPVNGPVELYTNIGGAALFAVLFGGLVLYLLYRAIKELLYPFGGIIICDKK